MKGIVLPAFLLFVAACAADPDLEWVTPLETDVVPAGDPIELAVATAQPDAVSVRFMVDGTELAVCDPRQADEDCKREDIWRWTTTFSTLGPHEIVAISLDADGNEIESAVKTLMVVKELQLKLDDEDLVPDGIDEELSLGDNAPAVGELAATGRGYLDPARAYHSVFGGIQWKVTNQTVVLHSGTPRSSVSAIRSCMNRYGASIRRWADHYKMSRASVVATAMAESSCTNPAGSSDGLSSGPMQVTASTCSAITGLSRTTCRSRMHTSPDFSFQVGTKYMASSYQVSQHRHDPPKIAAAYNAGSVRSSSANRWHMLTTGNHIDRWVSAYNAYRSWEAGQ